MLRLAVFLVLAFGFTLSHSAAGDPLSDSEQRQWLRHLLPLPHEISISGKISVKPADISVAPVNISGDAAVRAIESLSAFLREKTAAELSPNGTFRFVAGIIGKDGTLDGISVPGADRLKSLPNSDQAYIIRSQGEKTLLLAALDGKGLYYAVLTLIQLLEPFAGESAVTIPLLTVTDWPDMEERGLWNFPDPPQWIPWLSSLKLNYGKMASTQPVKVRRGVTNKAAIDKDLMIEARSMGFSYVPYIIHLNFLHDYGLFEAYPELAGIGDSALAGRYFAHKYGNQHRVPCAKNPLLTKIITEWMTDIASHGANEVSCWLSERPAQCGHEECIREGQFLLEARAFIKAWEETRKAYPDFVIRLFISTTTNERYYKILAETPKDVKLERCCSTDLERVRSLPRDRFVNPLFDRYAKDGWWVAQYDVPIGAYGRVETPEFKVPGTTAHRIRDYVTQLAERNYSGAYGMIAWGNKGVETCGYNIAAMAEWTWNAGSRDEREFAIAWATREGFARPESFADWSDIVGPIEFDVYESDFPTCYSWGKMTDMIERKEMPVPGEGVFRYYLSERDFDIKLELLGKARDIAMSFNDPYFLHETDIVLSYVLLAREIFRIGTLLAAEDPLLPENQTRLRQMTVDLKKAGVMNAESIKTWRSGLGPEPWHQRVHDAIDAVEETVANISGIVNGRYLY